MSSCAQCGAALSGAGACTCGAAASALEQEVIFLFDQLRHRLLRYLLSLGLPASDGEEIVQEVFLALFRHLCGGKPRTNLRAWIFQVAHNMGLKKRKQVRRHAQSMDEQSAPESRPFIDQTPNPEDQAAGRQRQTRLLNVLRVLPEQDRRCLSLRAEGLKYREIAEVLGISLGAVSLSLERSLARLARADKR